MTNPETDGFGIRNYGVRGGGCKRLHKNVNYPLANKHQVKKQGTNLERCLQHIARGSCPYYVKTLAIR